MPSLRLTTSFMNAMSAWFVSLLSRRSFLLALAIAASPLACAPGTSRDEDNYSAVHSDSGIQFPTYSSIVDKLNNLAKTYSDVATVITYGKSLGGRPLTMLKIAKSGTISGDRPAIVIEGAIHGDEYLGIEDRLPGWFLEHQNSGGVQQFLNSGGILLITPVLNPDGFTARRRENNEGQDLNRDFDLHAAGKKGFSEPETTDLVQTIKDELAADHAKLKLTLDYHCCIGGLIYPWGYSATRELPAAEKAEHQRVAKIILQDLPYPSGRAIQVVNYTAIGASDDFFHETFDSLSYTFEGAQGGEARNFDKHTRFWDKILADQSGQQQISGGNTGGSGNPNGNDLNLAIASESGSGLIKTAAASETAQSMALCRGNAVACLADRPNIVTDYGAGQKLGDRWFFKSDVTISVSSGEVYTLLARDDAGKVVASRVVKFVSR